MALFKHKNGGICEVLTEENIVKLRKNTDYKEIKEKTKESRETKKEKQELEDDKILEK